MNKVLPVCIAASLVLVGAWAEDGASRGTAVPAAAANGSVAPAPSKEPEKKAEKKPKPKPTKKSRKTAPRSAKP